MNILDRINKPNDIKDIDREDLPELADEIREFLVSHVSEDRWTFGSESWMRGTYNGTSQGSGFP